MPWPKAQSWELILLLSSFSSYLSLHHHNSFPFLLLPSCLFVYAIFRWEVSATAYCAPLTLIGGRGCADWALIAAFPFAFVPSSLLSLDTHSPLPDTTSHTHSNTARRSCSVSLSVNIKHTARVGADTVAWVLASTPPPPPQIIALLASDFIISP